MFCTRTVAWRILRTPANLVFRTATTNSKTPQETLDRIDSLVKKDKLVLFMKGTPTEPMCGFSKTVCQVLEHHGVADFRAYNVLSDEALRSGVKDYSSWPTIPQLFIGGEFVGGCDIVLEMHKSGELVKELDSVGIESNLKR